MADDGKDETHARAEGTHGEGARGGDDAEEQGRGTEPARGKGQAGKALPKWPFLLGGLVMAAFVGIVLYVIFASKPDIWTDDAYVTVHYASVSPRVSGQVATVGVTDNQVVRAGDLLVTLDPRNYEASVDMARAALDRDQAQVGDASANVARQPSLVTQQEASVSAAAPGWPSRSGIKGGTRTLPRRAPAAVNNSSKRRPRWSRTRPRCKARGHRSRHPANSSRSCRSRNPRAREW